MLVTGTWRLFEDVSNTQVCTVLRRAHGYLAATGGSQRLRSLCMCVLCSGVRWWLLRARKTVLAESSGYGCYRCSCAAGWCSQRTPGTIFSLIQRVVPPHSVHGVQYGHIRVRDADTFVGERSVLEYEPWSIYRGGRLVVLPHARLVRFVLPTSSLGFN